MRGSACLICFLPYELENRSIFKCCIFDSPVDLQNIFPLLMTSGFVYVMLCFRNLQYVSVPCKLDPIYLRIIDRIAYIERNWPAFCFEGNLNFGSVH